jgi:outer membrane lipoprotein-sorting protein
MRFILAALLLPALVQNGGDAEKPIRTMEKKLGAAKTLRVSFEAKVEGLPESGTFKGTLTVAESNKMHLEGTVEMEGKRVNWKVVSDGARTKEQGLESGTRPTSKKLTENYRSSLTHGGYIMGIYMSTESEGRESWPIFRASEFKLEKKEKIGKRQAQVIVCKLTPLEKLGKKDLTFSETLWLDVETNLPLKRIFTGTVEGKKITFTETYGTFTLDPKIDAKLFELPK